MEVFKVDLKDNEEVTKMKKRKKRKTMEEIKVEQELIPKLKEVEEEKKRW